MVLDGLRLVEDAGVKLLPLVKRLVTPQQIVAGHHEVGGGPALSQLGAVGGVAVHHHAGEFGREFLTLLGPVQHQRGRADDEAGQRLPVLLHGQQVAQHLHRLAQAHIVGEDAAHTVTVQRPQPAVAVPLIFAQSLLQGGRRGILAVLDGVEAPADAPEGVIPVEAHTGLARQRPVEAGRTVKRKLGVVLAQLCAGEFQRFVQFVQHFQRVIQPQQSAIPQAVVALFLVERLKQSFQLAHREFAGVHLQIKHTALYRHTHRDLRRRSLQVAECIAEVDFALCQQGRHTLFKESNKGILVVCAIFGGAGVGLLGQISLEQPPGPTLCAGVPQ